MTVVVVDASAVGALIFGEPEQARVADLLRDRELHAPAIMPLEVANVGVKKARRRLLDRGQVLEALALMTLLSIAIDAIDAETCAETALAAGLSAYDAAYLILATRLDAPLITLDTKLQRVFDGYRS